MTAVRTPHTTTAEDEYHDAFEEQDTEDVCHTDCPAFPFTEPLHDVEWDLIRDGRLPLSLFGQEGRLWQHLSQTSPLQWRKSQERVGPQKAMREEASSASVGRLGHAVRTAPDNTNEEEEEKKKEEEKEKYWRQWWRDAMAAPQGEYHHARGGPRIRTVVRRTDPEDQPSSQTPHFSTEAEEKDHERHRHADRISAVDGERRGTEVTNKGGVPKTRTSTHPTEEEIKPARSCEETPTTTPPSPPPPPFLLFGEVSSCFENDSRTTSSSGTRSGRSSMEEEREAVRGPHPSPHDDDDDKKRTTPTQSRTSRESKRLPPFWLPFSTSWSHHHHPHQKKDETASSSSFPSFPPPPQKEEKEEEEEMTKTFFYHWDHGSPHTCPPWMFSLKEDDNCEFPYCLGWLKEVQVQQKSKTAGQEEKEKKKNEAVPPHVPAGMQEEEPEAVQPDTRTTHEEEEETMVVPEPPLPHHHSSPLPACKKDLGVRPPPLPPKAEEEGAGTTTIGIPTAWTPKEEDGGVPPTRPAKTMTTNIQNEEEKEEEKEKKNGAGPLPRGDVQREKKRKNGEAKRGAEEEEVFLAYVGGKQLGTLEEEVARGKRKIAALYNGGTVAKPAR